MKRCAAVRKTLLGALLLIAANVYGGEGGAAGFDWLKVVIFAEYQTDYSGVFVYQYDTHVETSRITHVTDGEGEYERLESLDGPKREIVRHHGQVWNHLNHEMVPVDSHPGRGKFPSLLPEQLSALSANYQTKLLGVERVAGYDAQVILFQPKDNLRYTHKIWVHTDSGLLLKAAALDGKNQMVEQYAFTQLQIGGKIDRSGFKHGAVAGFRDPGFHEKHKAGRKSFPVSSGWTVGALPSGFRKTMEIQRQMHENHAPVTQIVFSDGLSAISVFIEEDDGDEDDFEGLSSRGVVNLYHKVVGRHLFTVVGEVPPHTVMRTLDSIRHNGK